MKIPVSKLKSEDLEALFQKSSIMEQHFFPRKVPSSPFSDTPSKEAKISNTDITTKREVHEKSVETC